MNVNVNVVVQYFLCTNKSWPMAIRSMGRKGEREKQHAKKEPNDGWERPAKRSRRWKNYVVSITECGNNEISVPDGGRKEEKTVTSSYFVCAKLVASPLWGSLTVCATASSSLSFIYIIITVRRCAHRIPHLRWNLFHATLYKQIWMCAVCCLLLLQQHRLKKDWAKSECEIPRVLRIHFTHACKIWRM